jgi:hypothetical protein
MMTTLVTVEGLVGWFGMQRTKNEKVSGCLFSKAVREKIVLEGKVLDMTDNMPSRHLVNMSGFVFT